MEKNIHDKNLDDFVQKSFEQYEEEPSDFMWDRIDAALPDAPVQRVPALWFRQYRWQLAAAIAILLLVSRLVCVQFYYEEKIRALSQPVASETASSSGSQSTNAPASSAADSENTPLANSQTTPRNAAAGATKKPQPARFTPDHTTSRSPEKSSANLSTGNSPVGSNQPQLPEHALETTEDAALPTISATNVAPVTALDALTHPISPVDFKNVTPSPHSVDAPIRKFNEPSGWYIGLSIAPHLVVEKPVSNDRPGPGFRRRFAAQQEHPQPSAAVMFRLGKRVTRRLSLETGIGFQALTRSASHRPRFEYQEGNLNSGAGMDARTFEYDLNTYSGAASIQMNTELRSSDAPAASDRVSALVRTKEHIQLVQVPLLAVYRLGQNRLKAVLKVGATGTFIAKNELEVDAFSLENNKLRFRNTDAYSVTLNRPKDFILGYQVSAGLEYWLGRQVSLSVAPAFSGDFPRNSAALGQLPGHTTFGLQAGVQWWF
jgi:hypothetical protein